MPLPAPANDFSLAAPKPVRGPAGRRGEDRLYTWDLLFRGERVGLYFSASRAAGGGVGRISLRSSRAIAPAYKALGAPKHWLGLDYIDGGPGWDWAARDLEGGVVPRGRSEQESLLALLAQRFQYVLASMDKTDGLPSMSGWAAPLVAASLIEKGWPVSASSAQAWLAAHQDWVHHVNARPAYPQEIHEGEKGQRWAVAADGSRRLCFNFERVAHPECGWLIEPVLFGAKFLNACHQAVQAVSQDEIASGAPDPARSQVPRRAGP